MPRKVNIQVNKWVISLFSQGHPRNFSYIKYWRAAIISKSLLWLYSLSGILCYNAAQLEWKYRVKYLCNELEVTKSWCEHMAALWRDGALLKKGGGAVMILLWMLISKNNMELGVANNKWISQGIAGKQCMILDALLLLLLLLPLGSKNECLWSE